jgi:hypothetical protein
MLLHPFPDNDAAFGFAFGEAALRAEAAVG